MGISGEMGHEACADALIERVGDGELLDDWDVADEPRRTSLDALSVGQVLSDLPSPISLQGLAHSMQQLQASDMDACSSMPEPLAQEQPGSAGADEVDMSPFDGFEESYLQFLTAHQQQLEQQEREQQGPRDHGEAPPLDGVPGQYALPPLQPQPQPAQRQQDSAFQPGIQPAGPSQEYGLPLDRPLLGPRLRAGIQSAGPSQEYLLAHERALSSNAAYARERVGGLRAGIQSAGPSMEFQVPRGGGGGGSASGLPPGSVLRRALESAGPSQEYHAPPAGERPAGGHGLPLGSVLRRALESAGPSQEYHAAGAGARPGSPADSSPRAPDVYPPPICSQAEVLDDSEVFFTALQLVHDAFGICEKVPRVGGRELDLHMLYRNVCELGGCAAVIEHKLWRDAAESFHYPDTITSVSFAFRKAYCAFLWHFEQIYLKRRAGQPVVPPPSSAQPREREPPAAAHADSPPAAASSSGRLAKRRKSGEQAGAAFPGLPAGAPTQLVAAARGAPPGGPDGLAVGARGSVAVDARFDAGFFVTVRLGRQEFRGVLYYPPPEHTREPQAERAEEARAPRPARSPFNLFSADARARIRRAEPSLPHPEVTKRIGALWQSMGKEARAPFVAMAAQDRQRWQAETDAHNYRLAAASAAQSASQAAAELAAAQQRAAARPPPPRGRPLASRGSASEDASETVDTDRR